MQTVKHSGPTGIRRREIAVALMIVVIFIALGIENEFFLTSRNLLNIGRQTSVVAIVALGEALVVIAGAIDLSVGSVLGLSAVIGAIVAASTGSQALAFVAAIASGGILGIGNGLLVTRLNINPFITTLGTLSIARGAALLATGGIPVGLSGAGVIDFFGASRLFNIPVSLLLMIGLAIGFHVFAAHMRIGRNIFAIGDSATAARLAGIDVDATRVGVFTISGLLAGLGGVILVGNLASADPNLGRGYELDVIAAVILGGTALSGGRGSILGVVLGALLMALLRNAFVFLGLSSHWQVLTQGLVILLAVAIDTARRKRED